MECGHVRIEHGQQSLRGYGIESARVAMSEMIELYDRLNIRYLKLRFTLTMLDEAELPQAKASAFRGGMGEMLLRMNCVADRDCDQCGFAQVCIPRNMMYSRMAIEPKFAGTGDSVGYVVECEDTETYCVPGQELQFNLLLLGNNIAYFGQYLQAFAMLGMYGIGRDRARFEVTAVANSGRETLVQVNNVYKENIKIKTVGDYVHSRIRKQPQASCLTFYTPLSVKYNGKMIERFDMEAIMTAASRRIYMLDCFENIDLPMLDASNHIPVQLSETARNAHISRYSSTHDERITLSGIRGRAEIAQPDETALALLYAGELLHIGKNTSFGFGRYGVS